MNLLISGGGTGGHIFPALAVWKALKQLNPDSQCFWLITRRGEGRILEREGLEYYELPVQPLQVRPGSVSTLLQSCVQALRILQQRKPTACLGTGGYASLPGILTSLTLGVPVVLLEQNVLPGKATRFLSPWAYAVCVSYPETVQYLPERARIEVTGNPIREEVRKTGRTEAGAHFGLRDETLHLLISGGSQGASAINHAVVNAFETGARLPHFQHFRVREQVEILHQTGSADEEVIKKAWREMGISAVVKAFFDDMPLALASADILIGRAGASTLAEMATQGLPSILIPYPYAGGHQEENARYFEKHSAAVVILQKEGWEKKLTEALWMLLTDENHRTKLSERVKALARPQAAEAIARFLLSVG